MGGAKDTGSGILDNDGVVTLRTALKKARAAGGCEELIRTPFGITGMTGMTRINSIP